MKSKKEIINQIDQLYKECSKENWDGEYASAVIQTTVDNTKKFIEYFPYNMPKPEVGVDPTGCFTFDWTFGKSKYIEITTMETSKIIWLYAFEKKSECILLDASEENINKIISQIIGFMITGKEMPIKDIINGKVIE